MSLNDFQNWALTQGQVCKHQGGYCGECVSLVNQYCWQVLNVPADAWGDAKDWSTNPNVLKYFDVVSDLRDGDIVTYGANFGGGYGHIVIYRANNQMLDQNGIKARKVAVGALWSGRQAILRVKGATQGGQDVVSNEGDVNKLYVRLLGRPAYDFTANKWIDSGAKNWIGVDAMRAVYEISDSPEGVDYERRVNAALAAPPASSEYVKVEDIYIKKS